MNISSWFQSNGIECISYYRNLSVPKLIEASIKRDEGILALNGTLLVRTGERTGRSPNDRYIVRESSTESNIDWNKVNIPISEDAYNHIFLKIQSFLRRKEVFVFDGFVGADPDYRLRIRVVAQQAWHALFATTLFLRPKKEELLDFEPDFTVYACGNLKLDGEKDMVRSNTAIVINFKQRSVLICGSNYGGEIKKSIFSVMNYLMPDRGVFPMHCSANVGAKGDTAIFFGLSGTGKTTLSADPSRRLIGDDEHGWSEKGIFNFEGGCYAKVIRLSKVSEPLIYNSIKFGSILENVIYDDETRIVDYDDASITENTRATYPVDYIPEVVIDGIGDHPRNIFFLTADAFGILPPIAKLEPEAAMYHFLSGYTAKVAGTESGIKEPQATFSACFGAPFLPRSPWIYARMLSDKMKKFRANCWLINTGWSGGPYGIGRRMSIELTRSIINAVLTEDLANAKFIKLGNLNLLIPEKIPGVDSKVLIPENTWPNKEFYREKMRALIEMFNKNFERFRSGADPKVIDAGPYL
ncbi:MAG: phosphoenolpyruvate carboxykinase (ATP) [Deltaproteobacteria bacterium]|nr:phosphoenolpyruvate carboxykinase (ATP) [Deltaproteobacteria bacterium]